MLTHSRYLIASAALLLALCSPSSHALQDGLQQRMSSADFKDTGLDTLSPQQLAHLDDWLRTHPQISTPMASVSAPPEFQANKKTKREKIQAHLVGHFGGWQADSQVTLDNGQVWKLVGSDQPYCRSADGPAATIKPALLNSWWMDIEGCAAQAHVQRVR